mmetsp:Transcript_49004/g.123274  ORF Transcript_49004/g.123274 Transcript_49004/m.123274 type:complete len:221 (+) Transcript_49004:2257-2919(+)
MPVAGRLIRAHVEMRLCKVCLLVCRVRVSCVVCTWGCGCVVCDLFPHAVRAFHKRATEITRVDERVLGHCAEELQVIHYGQHEHYHSHIDVFDKKDFPNSPTIQAGVARLLTMLVYLNDVEEGGETIFPHGGGPELNPYPLSETNTLPSADCSRGLKIKPQKGTAMLWYNLLADGHMAGEVDRSTLHAGCDVLRGEKWAANYWISNMDRLTTVAPAYPED